jgi:hypothetical protein
MSTVGEGGGGACLSAFMVADEYLRPSLEGGVQKGTLGRGPLPLFAVWLDSTKDKQRRLSTSFR